MTRQEDVIPVRAGDDLDWSSLELYLRSELELPSGEMKVQQFAAGQANLTYLVEVGDRRLVVRRPPKGILAPGAHDMAREARVLRALGDAYPRAPARSRSVTTIP